MRRAGNICLVIAVSFLTPSLAVAKAQDEGSGFRLWGGVMYGPASYSSESHVTNTESSVSGNQPGVLGGGDLWIGPRAGLLFEGELITANLNNNKIDGKYINQAATAAQAACRIFGTSATSAELVVFSGPAVNYFSSVRTYPGASFYDLDRLNVLGARSGIRFRVPTSKTVVLEAGAAVFLPLKLLGEKNFYLDRGSTNSVGFTLKAEYFAKPGIALGVGFRYEVNKIGYIPITSTTADHVRFEVAMPLLFLGFSL